MKKLLAFFTCMFVAISFTMAQSMEFETKAIDYGTVPQAKEQAEVAERGVREFKFTNTGDAPLIIERAKGSCGCTVPTYPTVPIMPGETASIKVQYDIKRMGAFTKYVTLTTNDMDQKDGGTPGQVQLKIFGTVE
jgi:hypothetical protein